MGKRKSSSMRIILISVLLSLAASQSVDIQEPPAGQRCSGRNYNGRRCCTPEQPCGLGEGDCDGPLDGGTHDGHQGCRGDLMCGSNNCKKFGSYFHEKDDCCDRPENVPVREEPTFVPGAPLEPPASLPSPIEKSSRVGDPGQPGGPAATPAGLAGSPERGSVWESAGTTISSRTRRESASIPSAISCKS